MSTTSRGSAAILACICAPILTLATAAAADPPAAAANQTPAAGQRPEDSRPNLATLMERNGDSLFRAENASRPQTPASDNENAPAGPPGSLAAVSFFAVADPKPKTYKKHDLVTIIARENSAFTSDGNSQLSKQQDIDMKLNSFINLRPSLEQLRSVVTGATNVPEINLQNTRDFTGKGTVDRTDTFSDRVTAEVVDVKPNGTLVLQAIKHIKTDEEEQRMILSGICRASDVAADNTVLTTQLFDLELTQTHSGQVNDTTTRGLIPRLLDTFSPF